MRKDGKTTAYFETPNYLRFEQVFQESIRDPLEEVKAARIRAAQALKAQREAYNSAMRLAPDTPIPGHAAAARNLAEIYKVTDEIKAASEAARAWKDKHLVVKARDVALLLDIEQHRQWRYNHGIPVNLTAAQAAYLLDGRPKSRYVHREEAADRRKAASDQGIEQSAEVFMAFPEHFYDEEGEAGEDFIPNLAGVQIELQRAYSPTAGYINPSNPEKDPLVKYTMRKALTKVGRTYGNWTFLRCMSKSEATTNNAVVVYKAKCGKCGEVSDVPYRTAKTKACLKCSAKERVENRTVEEKQERIIKRERDRNKINKPVRIWVTASGFKMQGTCPEDATGKVIFTSRGSTFNVEALDEQDLQDQRNIYERQGREAVLAERLAAMPEAPPQISGYENTTSVTTSDELNGIADTETDETLDALQKAHKNLDIPDFG